jgi:methionyl-tRNA formyltransferase
MVPLRIIFAGSGEFGLPTLQALVDSPHEIVQVISQPDRPAGRGRKLTPTPIAHFAQERGLPLLTTADINAETLPPADLMLAIAFGQKIAPHQVDHARLGSLNLHASRLPKYRGAAPINWAILSGDTVTGNSVIRLARKMDAGRILAQSQVDIGELETAGELHDRLARDGAQLVAGVLQNLQAGHVQELPQDDSLATRATKLSRASTKLDWSGPADALARQVRAFYPWPGCRVRVLDAMAEEIGRLTLVRARPGPGETGRWRPGELQTTGHVTAGGDSAVEIIEVHPEGKRAMPLEAYRRGHPWLPGMRLESVV